MSKNVPYKALSGFANKGTEKINLESSAGRMIAYIIVWRFGKSR